MGDADVVGLQGWNCCHAQNGTLFWSLSVTSIVCWGLVSEPDPSQKKGLGTHVHPSCPQDGSWNVDLTNQNRWLRITSWKWFFFRLSVPPTTRYGKSLCCSVFYPSTWRKLRGGNEQIGNERARGVATNR